MTEIQNTNNIPELHSPFEQLREVDADDKEWWNSRKLAKKLNLRPRKKLGFSTPKKEFFKLFAKFALAN